MVSTRLGEPHCAACDRLKSDGLAERKVKPGANRRMLPIIPLLQHLPAGRAHARPGPHPEPAFPFTYVRKHSGWPVALSTSFRHRSRVRRRQTRGAMAAYTPGHSAACTGRGPLGNRATKTRLAQPEPGRQRFRGVQVPDPPHSRANGSARTFTGPLVSSSAFELSLNFLFCIPGEPKGVTCPSFLSFCLNALGGFNT